MCSPLPPIVTAFLLQVGVLDVPKVPHPIMSAVAGSYAARCARLPWPLPLTFLLHALRHPAPTGFGKAHCQRCLWARPYRHHLLCACPCTPSPHLTALCPPTLQDMGECNCQRCLWARPRRLPVYERLQPCPWQPPHPSLPSCAPPPCRIWENATASAASGLAPVACLFMGDLNLAPGSPLYQFLSSGHLPYASIDRTRLAGVLGMGGRRWLRSAVVRQG